jgi:hypothetical protein
MQASGPPVGASRKTRVAANGETTSRAKQRLADERSHLDLQINLLA